LLDDDICSLFCSSISLILFSNLRCMPSCSLLGSLFRHVPFETDFLISHPFSRFLMHLVRTI
jgi:hypothetical protein